MSNSRNAAVREQVLALTGRDTVVEKAASSEVLSWSETGRQTSAEAGGERKAREQMEEANGQI